MSSKIVEYSFFYNISSSSSGGVVSELSNDELNVSFCVFAFCSSVLFGGAVYSKANKNLVLNSCFYSNKCGKYGADIFLEGISQNFVERSAFLKAITSESESLGLRNGVQVIRNVNNTMCTSYCVPTSIICSCTSAELSYYNSVSNYGQCGFCSYLYTLKNIHQYGNFINNTLTEQSLGTLRFDKSSPDFHWFVFINNQGTISYQIDSPAPGTLYNSYLSCSALNLGSGFSSAENCYFSIQSAKLYSIFHVNTYYCIPKDYQNTQFRSIIPIKTVLLMFSRVNVVYWMMN